MTTIDPSHQPPSCKGEGAVIQVERQKTARWNATTKTIVKVVTIFAGVATAGGGGYVLARNSDPPAHISYHNSLRDPEEKLKDMTRDDMVRLVSDTLDNKLLSFRAEFEVVKSTAEEAKALTNGIRKYVEDRVSKDIDAISKDAKETRDSIHAIDKNLAKIISRLETEDRINASKPK